MGRNERGHYAGAAVDEYGRRVLSIIDELGNRVFDVGGAPPPRVRPPPRKH